MADGNQQVEDTDVEEASPQATEDITSVEPLSDREIAIAQGQDPDQDASAPEGDTDDTTAGETSEADETAEGVSKEASPEEAEDPETWIDNEAIQTAESYGLEAGDLEGFDSLEEFNRATRLLAKQASNFAIQSDPQQEREEPAESPDPTPAEAKEELDHPAFDKDGNVDPEWFEKEEYDEATVMLARSFRKTQDKLNQSQQDQNLMWEHVAIEEQNRQINAFHDTMDKLDPEFYGKSLDEDGNPIERLPEEHGERRQKTLVSYQALVDSMTAMQKANGKQVKLPSEEALRVQAHEIAHPERTRKVKSIQQVAKLRKQSNKRRRVGSSNGAQRSNRVAMSAEQIVADDLINDPELIAAYRGYQEENGSL